VIFGGDRMIDREKMNELKFDYQGILVEFEDVNKDILEDLKPEFNPIKLLMSLIEDDDSDLTADKCLLAVAYMRYHRDFLEISGMKYDNTLENQMLRLSEEVLDLND